MKRNRKKFETFCEPVKNITTEDLLKELKKGRKEYYNQYSKMN